MAAVRIRVHAAAVNPTDTMLRSGIAHSWLGSRPAPYVPGMDAAGVVDAIGPGTDTLLRPGDPVIAIVEAYSRQAPTRSSSSCRRHRWCRSRPAPALRPRPRC
ncbi:alcohol dehydrogenase catalytic domain-containing protein [Kribbella sp. NPDC051620]|uniref:alcohol dehydrogenase catalytic domain-containing protein n=1 Tax=Kribbella sp. NPDC051620 TaxID=3364120 RepID=UPI0037A2A8ED